MSPLTVPLTAPVASRFTARNTGLKTNAWGGSAGWWARLPAGAVELTWTRLDVGDTSYTDLQGRARWHRGALEVVVSAGARVASHSGGKGAYGDFSATLRLSDGMALVVAGGNYLSDPVRGSIPGRFVTAGVRLTPRSSWSFPRSRRLRAGPAADWQAPPGRSSPCRSGRVSP